MAIIKEFNLLVTGYMDPSVRKEEIAHSISRDRAPSAEDIALGSTALIEELANNFIPPTIISPSEVTVTITEHSAGYTLRLAHQRTLGDREDMLDLQEKIIAVPDDYLHTDFPWLKTLANMPQIPHEGSLVINRNLS